jgi:hypothetical protein
VHGPPLTPQEAVASVARRVRRLEAQGLDRDRAIRRVAVETGIAPEKVRWCAETAGGPSAGTIDSGDGGDQPRPRSDRGKHSIRARKENTVRTSPGSRRQRPQAPLALAAAAVVAGLLALASPAGAAANTLDAPAPGGAQPAPGDLDPWFGAGGKAALDLGPHDIATAVTTQPDGKIVVVGRDGVGLPDFAVARYNQDGGLDTSFDGDGVQRIPFGRNDLALAVAIGDR